MKKKLFFAAFVFTFFFLLHDAYALPSNVVQEGENYYYYENGIKYMGGFQVIDDQTYFFSRVDGRMRTGMFAIDGPMYYFDDQGVMQTGIHTIDGITYYFDEDGKMATGFRQIEGKTYFFSRVDGRMRTGMFAIDGPIYYFDDQGVMQTGLFQMDGKTLYFDEDGKMAIGFKVLEGKTYFFSQVDGRMRTGMFSINGIGPMYYFDDNGVMQTGMRTIDGITYYFDEDGKMGTGFRQIEGKTYFFSRVDGRMRTGMFAIDGPTYYFDNQGVMQTGLITIENKKYYFNNDGKMHMGFKGIGDKKYFFSRIDGQMKYGWIFVVDSTYYLDTSGAMVTGNQTIDQMNYYFYPDGKLRSGWVTDVRGNRYYIDAYGNYLRDWAIVEGKKCFFNGLGVLIKEDAKYIIDVSAHQGVIDWDTVKNSSLVDGVIVRVAAGSDQEDAQLARNIRELNRLNIPYGIYIYSYAEDKISSVNGLGYNLLEGQLEAERVLNAIRKYDMKLTYPIYYDLESNIYSSLYKPSVYESIVRAFGSRLAQAGYDFKIYTYTNWADTALNSSYLRSKIDWIAHYNHYCGYTGSYRMWQYGSNDYVPGINGRVDGNVLFY